MFNLYIFLLASLARILFMCLCTLGLLIAGQIICIGVLEKDIFVMRPRGWYLRHSAGSHLDNPGLQYVEQVAKVYSLEIVGDVVNQRHHRLLDPFLSDLHPYPPNLGNFCGRISVLINAVCLNTAVFLGGTLVIFIRRRRLTSFLLETSARLALGCLVQSRLKFGES
jgi:hypothetical protein